MIFIYIYRTLIDLTNCYKEVFTKGCGQEGGEVMGGLMARAFQDPRYLWYKYKPDCELHADPNEPYTQEGTRGEQPLYDATLRPPESRTHRTHRPRTHKPKNTNNQENESLPKSERNTYSNSVSLQHFTSLFVVCLSQLVTHLMVSR